MLKSIVWKELRETWWMGAVALVAVLFGAASDIGLSLDNWRLVARPVEHRIPFKSGDFVQYLLFTAYGLAMALAAKQTLWETFRGTWPFLLHRSLTRSLQMLLKLAVGLSLLLVAVGLPIFLFGIYASDPGSFAAPFSWRLTDFSFCICLAVTSVYLGAFASAIRQARWYATRIFPAAVGFAVSLFPLATVDMPNAGWTFSVQVAIGLVLFVDVAFVSAILFWASDNDFA